MPRGPAPRVQDRRAAAVKRTPKKAKCA